MAHTQGSGTNRAKDSMQATGVLFKSTETQCPQQAAGATGTDTVDRAHEVHTKAAAYVS